MSSATLDRNYNPDNFLTTKEKIDRILKCVEGLEDTVDAIQSLETEVSEMREQMEEITEKLTNLGLDNGEGFGYES